MYPRKPLFHSRIRIPPARYFRIRLHSYRSITRHAGVPSQGSSSALWNPRSCRTNQSVCRAGSDAAPAGNARSRLVAIPNPFDPLANPSDSVTKGAPDVAPVCAVMPLAHTIGTHPMMRPSRRRLELRSQSAPPTATHTRALRLRPSPLPMTSSRSTPH